MPPPPLDVTECFSDSPFFRSRLVQGETKAIEVEEFMKTLSRSARGILDAGQGTPLCFDLWLIITMFKISVPTEK